MELDPKLQALYDDYYEDGSVAEKRRITARQTFEHVRSLLGTSTPAKIIDIGSGDGAVLQAMADRNFAGEYYAVDISNSGVSAIRARSIVQLREAKLFDGYTIPYPDNSFDFGLAVHVLEHVEHERAFIREVTRVCRRCYIEVPLELTVRVNRAMKISGKFGHINFYTKDTFRNLLETSGVNVDRISIFPHGKEFQTHEVGGRLKGTLKYFARTSLLKAHAAPGDRHIRLYVRRDDCGGQGKMILDHQ